MPSELNCLLCDYQASAEIDIEAHIFKSHSEIFHFRQHPDLPNEDASKLVANLSKNEGKETTVINISEKTETSANTLPKTKEKETTVIKISEKTEITANNLPKTEVLIKGVSNLTN